MKRREFITTLGGSIATLAWGHQGRAAHDKTKRVLLGYIASGSPAEAEEFAKMFLDQLRELGYIEKQNFEIAFRFASRQDDQIPRLAQELVSLSPDVTVTPSGDFVVLALRAATQTVPIVCSTLGDPVRSGLIGSFSRPEETSQGYP